MQEQATIKPDVTASVVQQRAINAFFSQLFIKMPPFIFLSI
jgi:hypothetical protein